MTEQDGVLMNCWRLVLALDETAKEYKRAWRNYRLTALNLSLFMLLLATFVTWFSPLLLTQPATINLFGMTIPFDWIELATPVFQLTLVIMPLLITGLMAFTSEFQSTPVWLIYRQQVDALNRQIMLYRQHAGPYRINTYVDYRTNQQRMLAQMEATYKIINEYQETAPISQQHYPDDVVRTRVDDHLAWHPADNGFGQLPINDYLDIRVEPTMQWYEKALKRRLRDRRRARVINLILTGTATLAVAIGVQFAWLLIVINGLISYFTALSTLDGEKANTGAFAITAQNLGTLVASWKTLSDREQANPDNTDLLVVRAEDIIAQEANASFQQIMKTALEVDGTLNATVSNMTGGQVTPETVQSFATLSRDADVTVEETEAVADEIFGAQDAKEDTDDHNTDTQPSEHADEPPANPTEANGKAPPSRNNSQQPVIKAPNKD